MSDTTIIGTGNMGSGSGIQVLDLDVDKADEFAAKLGAEIDAGKVGEPPTGNLVVLAVPFDAAKELVTDYGAALPGKTIIDLTNPVDLSTVDSLVVAPGTAAAETIADLADDGDHVVKRSTPPSRRRCTPVRSTDIRWMCSSPATPRRPRRTSPAGKVDPQLDAVEQATGDHQILRWRLDVQDARPPRVPGCALRSPDTSGGHRRPPGLRRHPRGGLPTEDPGAVITVSAPRAVL